MDAVTASLRAALDVELIVVCFSLGWVQQSWRGCKRTMACRLPRQVFGYKLQHSFSRCFHSRLAFKYAM
jgi:hypothetical protein